ncbi:ATP-binding protein [Paenibacillus tyrfis]|uniref:ATP-binding protein n=1 Tax=Paenibacillus tyrfis TaxID=1501230 RepID=UPI0020A0260E|nr:ATP-binding protein [Paenibacillus tyrfis]MCP1312493.1 ATP-binding protein [Paenibacillus tyrfis]
MEYPAERQLFAIIMGDCGTGKTTTSRRFTSALSPEKYKILYLSDSKLMPRHFYKGMLEQFGCESKFYRSDAKRQLHREIEFMHGVHRLRPVVVEDEAHLLDREMLEEVRFLLNFKMDALARWPYSGIEKMHFARRPNPVRIGDILICYGVGTTKLLGYFEVVSDPYIWDSTSRWSWELEAKNLCPEYSESWVTFDITTSSIVASYDHVHPVTNVGGKTLGALQYGWDRIQLSDEFARHVIELIEGSVTSKKVNK